MNPYNPHNPIDPEGRSQDWLEIDRRTMRQILRQRRVIHRQALIIWVQLGVIAALCLEIYRTWR